MKTTEFPNSDSNVPTELENANEQQPDQKPSSVDNEVGISSSSAQQVDQQLHQFKSEIKSDFNSDEWSHSDDIARSAPEESDVLLGRPRKSSRRRRLIAGSIFLVVASGAVLLAFYALRPSQSVRINLGTNQKPDRATDSTATREKPPDELTAEAIAEIRSAMPRTDPAVQTGSQQSQNGLPSVLPQSSDDLTAALNTSVLPPVDNSAKLSIEDPAKLDGDEASTNDRARRNREKSIRFELEPEAVHEPEPTRRVSIKRNESASQNAIDGYETPGEVPKQNSKSLDSRLISSIKPASSPKSDIKLVTLPQFGSILPVRTLGKIYSLRAGSPIRLELTRRVEGEGWTLQKGTTFIGQLRGSERDRAFLAITGFIDSEYGHFVPLSGEVLGDDGASGIPGKFHKLSSGWSRAFARVGSTAINVAGAIASGRISGQPVIVTDFGSRIISPFSNEVNTTLLQQTRGFVEVPAGSSAFIMITTLPSSTKGVEAERKPVATLEDTVTAGSSLLSDDELALLLTSGDRIRIREGLPRMSPEMRRIAEQLLKDPTTKSVQSE